MGNIITIALFLLGLGLIIKGGDFLVDSALFIARKFGIPTIVIGTSLVSFLTTVPELTVSISAINSNSQGIAVGNAIGSTICNIGLILSLVLIVKEVVVDKTMFRNKSGIMLLSLFVLIIISYNGVIELLEAIILFSIVILFFAFNIISQRKKTLDNDFFEEEETSLKKEVMTLIIATIMVFIGSRLLVSNGIIIARLLNVPEVVIGLTMVAVGTSLPELVTVMSSVKKGESNLAIGNIIGANILNIALIIPMVTFFSGGTLVLDRSDFVVFGAKFTDAIQTLIVDAPFSFLLMIIMIIPFVKNARSNKFQGLLLLGLYIFYLVALYTMY